MGKTAENRERESTIMIVTLVVLFYSIILLAKLFLPGGGAGS